MKHLGFPVLHIVLRMLLVCSLASLAANLGALPLAQLIPGAGNEHHAELLAGESLTLDATEGRTLFLVPATTGGEEILASIAKERPAYLVESGYLLRGIKIDDMLALYNALTAFRTMSGITYFSFNRNRETVLYDHVFRTEGPGSRRELPDTTVMSLPALSSFNIHIKDANFGSTWYSLSIQIDQGGLSMAMRNTQPIGILVVRAFGREQLRTRFLLNPVDEGIFVYGACLADPAPAAAKLVDMYWAVAKRLDAVREWTAQRLKSIR